MHSAPPAPPLVCPEAMQRSPRVLVVMLLAATAHAVNTPFSREGSIVFTDSITKRLLRLDGADGMPRVIAHDLATYGGLVPWKGMMLAAGKRHEVMEIDPWCEGSACGSSTRRLVDVPKALGVGKVVDGFALGGMALCGDGALFVAYGGGNATVGHSGVLRCEGCEPKTDCTSKCAVVDGGESPGAGMHQLGGYAAGVECVGDSVLVADNTNLRVQAIPASCPRSPCNISTFASQLNYPLGISRVGTDTILVTLDSSIISLALDGQVRRWSTQGDCGYLVQAGKRVFVANGNIISFDSSCRGPDCAPSLVWNATGGIEVYGGVAYITAPAVNSAWT